MGGRLEAHFVKEIEPVVDNHSPDNQEDAPDVNRRDPVENGFFRGPVDTHMHLPGRKALIGSFMALPAGHGEVVRMNEGFRIVHPAHVVIAVAAAAVDNFNRAPAGRKSVEAVLEGIHAVGVHPVALGELV